MSRLSQRLLILAVMSTVAASLSFRPAAVADPDSQGPDATIRLRALRPGFRPLDLIARGLGSRLYEYQGMEADVVRAGTLSVAALGQRVVIAGARLGENGPQGGRIGVAIAPDGGRTVPPLTILNSSQHGPLANDAASDRVFGADIGHPSLSVDGNGTCYLAVPWTTRRGQRRIGVLKSTDAGASWSPPASVTDNGYFKSFPSLVAATGESVQPTSLYACYSLWDQSGGGTLTLARSADGGLTFRTVQVPVSGSVVRPIPQIAVGPRTPEGEPVFVAWLDPGARGRIGAVKFAHSPDGAHWSAGGGRTLATLHLDPGSNRRPQRPLPGITHSTVIPAIAVDGTAGPQRGNVYVAFARGGNQSDSGVFVTSSADNGATWTEPRRVHKKRIADPRLPTAAVTPDGRVHVGYVYRQPHQRSLTVSVATSADGGATWADEQVTAR